MHSIPIRLWTKHTHQWFQERHQRQSVQHIHRELSNRWSLTPIILHSYLILGTNHRSKGHKGNSEGHIMSPELAFSWSDKSVETPHTTNWGPKRGFMRRSTASKLKSKEPPSTLNMILNECHVSMEGKSLPHRPLFWRLRANHFYICQEVKEYGDLKRGFHSQSSIFVLKVRCEQQKYYRIVEDVGKVLMEQ